jgi:hypothetical protein
MNEASGKSRSFGRSLHLFNAADFPVPQGPSPLWIDHQKRASKELPIWMLSTRQIALANVLNDNAAYRMARVSNVVALTHNLCLTLDPLAIEAYLSNLDPDMRGFAVEGVGMGLFSRELATPGTDNELLDAFLTGTGRRFSGLGFTGVGLAHIHSRHPFRSEIIDRWSGLARWLILDGLGFWAGKMEWAVYGKEGAMLPGVDGSHQRIFDRGLGRSGWFENGADPDRVIAWLKTCAEERRRDLAFGVGVAATFTGGVEIAELQILKAGLPDYSDDLAAGSANAAETRLHAGIDTPYTERACQTLTGMSVADAAAAAREVRSEARGDEYEELLSLNDRLRSRMKE